MCPRPFSPWQLVRRDPSCRGGAPGSKMVYPKPQKGFEAPRPLRPEVRSKAKPWKVGLKVFVAFSEDSRVVAAGNFSSTFGKT